MRSRSEKEVSTTTAAAASRSVQFTGRLDAVLVRHLEVHQHDVGTRSSAARRRASSPPAATLSVAGANEQFNLSPDGFIGGVQAGYNWQAANWVFGVESRYSGVDDAEG